MTFLIIRQPEVVDPEFLLDIPVKVSDIIEVLLLCVYNYEILKRDLESQSRRWKDNTLKLISSFSRILRPRERMVDIRRTFRWITSSKNSCLTWG
jgi:hypothetical protein